MNDKSSKGNSFDFENFINSQMGKLPRGIAKNNSSLIDQLKIHGFAINRKNSRSILKFYDSAMITHPMFVTSDYIFYFLTQLLDLSLMEIERCFLISRFKQFAEHLLKSQLNLYDSALPESLQKLLRENIALLTVVCRLQNPNFSIPMMVESLVSNELANLSQERFADSEIFQFKEDFSLYKVRGHYSHTPDFQNYFKAMLYLQRMLFMFQGKDVNEPKKQILTHRAFLLLLSFEDQKIYSLWNQIDAFLEFWVGHTDDLTVNEYLDVWKKCEMPNPLKLSSKNFWDLVKNQLSALRDPLLNSRIYKPSAHYSPKFKGLRIFGQRYLVDSFIFQEMTHPNVKMRGFPSALDWMAFFGSHHAWDCLKSEGQINTQYEQQFQHLQPLIHSYFNNPFEQLSHRSQTSFHMRFHTYRHRYSSDKHDPKNPQRLNYIPNQSSDYSSNEKTNLKSKLSMRCDSVYAYFLYCVKGFWEDRSVDLPQFMESPLWDLKTLQTAAGAWAQARHSLILYAKQSLVCLGGPYSYGYIEPQPEVYWRMIDFISFLSDKLRFFIREFIPSSNIGEALSQTQSLLHQVLLISKKELENRVILPSDASFIRSFGRKTNELLKSFQHSTRQPIMEDLDSKIVDVHTEYYSQHCLEVGIGQAQEIIVIVPNHVGELRFTFGAVFPYYEFVQPIVQRLSDSEWQVIERSPSIPIPKWLQPLYLKDLDEIHKNSIKKIKRWNL